MLISSSLSSCPLLSHFSFFFFNDTATTEIYTLSLHDALPISGAARANQRSRGHPCAASPPAAGAHRGRGPRLRAAIRSRARRACEVPLPRGLGQSLFL